MSSTIKSYISQWFYGERSEISGPHEKFRICFCGKTSSESVEWYLIDVSVEKACLSEKTESSIKKLTPISVAKHFPSVYYAALGGRIYSLGGQRRSEGGGETLLKDVLILDLKSLDGFSAHSPAALAHWKPAPAVSGEDQGMKSVLIENLEPALVEDELEEDEDWKSARPDWNSFYKHMQYTILRIDENYKWPALRGKDWNSGTVSGEDQEDQDTKSGVDWRAEHWKSLCDEAQANRREDRRLALRGEVWNSGTVTVKSLIEELDKSICNRCEDWNSGTVSGEDQDMKSARSDVDWRAEYWPAEDLKGRKYSNFWKALKCIEDSKGVKDSNFPSTNSYWKALRRRERKTSISALARASEDWKPDTGKALRGLHWNSRSISALALASEDWKPDIGKALRGLYWNSRSISALSLSDWYSESIHALLLRAYMKSLTLCGGKGVDWKPGPPMTFARCNPHTMVVDDKLYVIGGFQPNQKQADGWIEFFDPVEEKWESLPSPPDLIHSSVMLSGLLKAKKEIIIARQRWDCHPILFYSYNIMTRCWNMLVPPESKVSVCLPPNIGRAVTVDNTLYWISTEEHNHECIIRSYDLDRNMWFEDRLNTATIFGRREHFSSIYSSGPGFLHLRDKKFCLLLQSTVSKKDPQSSIQYLYCVILDISPISEDEDRGKFELTTLSVQKYSMDHYISFLDCMLVSSD